MQIPETRHSLVARLSSPGDGEAWTEFLAGYEPFLLAMFRRRGLQEADAQDTAQQVLMTVAARVSEWRPDGRPASFRRWLTTIARNAAVKCLMKNARHSELESRSAPRRKPGAAEESAALHEYRQQALAWSIEQIREEFRPSSWAAFWETAVEGRPVEEVGAELGLSSGAVYMARSRVMARLRAKSKEFDVDDERGDGVGASD